MSYCHPPALTWRGAGEAKTKQEKVDFYLIFLSEEFIEIMDT